MQYNSYCLDEQNTEALCLNKAARSNLSQSNIVGKAPSMNGLRSSAVRLGNGSPIRGGQFVMSKKIKVCVYCGKEFETEHLGHKTCPTCTPDYKRYKARERDRLHTKLKTEQNSINLKVCLNCGTSFIPDILHPYQKFHNSVCQRQFNHRLETLKRTDEDNEKRKINYQIKKYIPSRKIKPITRICLYCGKEFTTKRSYQKYHPDCNRKLQTQTRNAIRHNINHVPYEKEFIFRRDKYICYLCGETVNMDAHFGAPDSPTIDHIIPISKGGDDNQNNVRTAHYSCNSQKSNKDILVGGQLKFLALSRLAGVASNTKKTPRSKQEIR
jgi:5-methylcytosine-specific restriction endonuclease McrA